MKKLILLLLGVFFFLGCTSNSIYKKPKNLIPKDSMVLLLKDMFIASSARNIKNKNLQRRISYLPLVYQKYQIDSLRFQSSNNYYTSRVDEYEKMLKEVLKQLEQEHSKSVFIKKQHDSIIKDSIAKRKVLKEN